jgi:hypothetical protein
MYRQMFTNPAPAADPAPAPNIAVMNGGDQ